MKKLDIKNSVHFHTVYTYAVIMILEFRDTSETFCNTLPLGLLQIITLFLEAIMSDFEILNNGNENSESSVQPAEASEPKIVDAQIIEDIPAQEPHQEEPVSEPVHVVEPEPAPSYAHTQYTNEYVYTPDVPAKKQTNAGRVLLGVVAALLSVFVVVVVTVSVYSFILESNGVNLNFDIQQDMTPMDKPNGEGRDPHQNLPGVDIPGENDPQVSETETDEANANASVNSTVGREYPTLSQLAAPEDALSIPDIYDKVSPSVVGVSCTLNGGTATGTGIIISSDGYIITNAHVIEDAKSVMIVDSNSEQYQASVVGYDTQTDLAVLKIEAEGLVACEFGISDELRIGELVVAIGNPLGFDLYGTITDGIISGLNRTLTIGENTMNLIQTNASINSGNSGGPLIDAYGRVIGITSAKVASLYGEGLGFAIPIDEALPIINDLMTHGYVTGRPMIGISGEDITPIMSMYYRLPEGVYVRFINPDSGAEKAGIKAGDIVIGAAGETITSMDELNEIKNRYSAGDTLTLTIYRDGKSIDVDVVLDEATQSE